MAGPITTSTIELARQGAAQQMCLAYNINIRSSLGTTEVRSDGSWNEINTGYMVFSVALDKVGKPEASQIEAVAPN